MIHNGFLRGIWIKKTDDSEYGIILLRVMIINTNKCIKIDTDVNDVNI